MTPNHNASALPADDLALISLNNIMPIVGMKHSALYARIAARKFPKPLRLSYRCARFRAGDIRTWLTDPLGWHQGKAIDAESALGGSSRGAA